MAIMTTTSPDTIDVGQPPLLAVLIRFRALIALLIVFAFFAALGAFDLIGATLLVILMRGVSRDARLQRVENGAGSAA